MTMAVAAVTGIGTGNGRYAGDTIRRHASPPAGACQDNPHGAYGQGLYRSAGLTIGQWHYVGREDSTSGIRQQNTYDLVITRRGTFVREGQGERTVASAGVATIWHPGDSFRVTHPVPGGVVCSIFRLAGDVVYDLLASSDPTSADVSLSRFPVSEAALDGPTYLAHRLAVLAAGRHHEARDQISALEVEELAHGFLHAFMWRTHALLMRRVPASTHMHRETRNRHGGEYVMRVREVVARSYRGALSLNAIAAEVGCSPFHLSRVVSAHEGISIYRMVLQLRLRDALERVLDTHDSLATIALDAGFASQSHFGDTFRREFGVAPGMVRKLGKRPALTVVRTA